MGDEGGILFDEILVQLEGVTVIEKPRVSRETMLDVMRNHTRLLRQSKKEIADVAALVNFIASEAADNKKQLKSLDETVSKHTNEVGELFSLVAAMRGEVDIMKKQINELIVLKQEVAQQKDDLSELKHKFEAHANNMVVYINKTTHAVAALDSKSNDVQLQLRELKDYVEHFGDNIVLASSQVTVESSAGYAERPISLLEVLKRCNTNITELSATCEDQETKIAENKRVIDTKADNDCLFDIRTLEKKVGGIEQHLKREEEQGISAIRKTCDNLKEEMGAMQTELSDKVRQKDVDDIVHKKYEDIVRYLEEALKTSEGEEESFARRAEDLEEKLERIANSKADRMEVSRMTEAVATNEATLVRITNMMKEKERSKDVYTKKEIADLLDMKVDKLDYEERMKDVMKQARKSKKMSAMTGGLSSILDDETITTMSTTAPPSLVNGPTSQFAANQPPGSANQQLARENLAWKGLADGLRDESNALLLQNPEAVLVDVQAQLQQLLVQQKAPSLSSADKAAVGNRIQQLLQTQQQLQHHMQFQSQSPSHIHPSMSSTEFSKTAPSGSQDFSQFVKGKRASKGVSAMALPSNNHPGQFRTATEGGQAGGEMAIPKNPVHAVDSPVEVDYYPNVPPDAKPGHDMSFLGGPYAGGGFNLRQGKLAAHSLKPMGMVPDQPTDIEGAGVMLKGVDGKLYYTDDVDTNNIIVGAPGPNVKPIAVKQRSQRGPMGDDI